MNNLIDLDQLISQHYNSYLTRPILMIILDTSGMIKFITHHANKLMSLPAFKLDNEVNYIEALSKSGHYTNTSLKKLETILSGVVSKKISTAYLMSLRIEDVNNSTLSSVCYCTQTPLFNQNDDLIGIQIVCTIYNNTPLENLLYNQDIRYDVKLIEQANLTPKQHYALFLLCNNFTQEEIAAIFQVTRGTITRMIVDQIAPKLGVIVANAFNVVVKAKLIGFQYQIPLNLFNDTIIIINGSEDIE